jgi:hypothetical protein
LNWIFELESGEGDTDNNLFEIVGDNQLKAKNQRLTNGNCKMPCSVILGSEKSQSGFALCGIFSPPHFFVPVKYFVFSLSDTKKRQLPRTLDEIKLGI